MINIRRCGFSDIENAPNAIKLLSEYAEECRTPEIGDPMIQPDTYHMMEASGVLFVICAYNDDKLIGFINLIVSVLPHYGKKIAATESFFVTSGERTSGAGMMLLKEAEVVAKDIGAVALMVSARTGSQLATLLDAKKQYRETNRIYTKCFR